MCIYAREMWGFTCDMNFGTQCKQRTSKAAPVIHIYAHPCISPLGQFLLFLPKETSLTDLAHYTFSREGESPSVGRGNTFIPCIICLHLQTDQAAQTGGLKGEQVA